MLVSAILAEKGRDVATAAPDTPVMSIIEDLSEKNIGAIVVTDERHSVVGIISERDVVRALDNQGATILDQPVSSFMTQSVVTCSEHESVHDLMSKMTSGRFRHLPVVADTRLSGIISIGDVVKTRIAEVEREANALRDYISSN
ncbi:MAG: CBS domain-containing protein [Cohaesibacteraceae bacterium]